MKTYKISIVLNKKGKHLLGKEVYLIFGQYESPKTLAEETIPKELIERVDIEEILTDFKKDDIVKITYKDGRSIITMITGIEFYPNEKGELKERISVRDSQ